MTSTLLILILTASALILTAILLALHRLSSIYQDFESFITPEGAEKPSPAAQVYAAMSAELARSIAAQLKSTFMSAESSLVRGSKVIDADIAEDIAEQNPLLSTILASFPKVRQTLRRNPKLIDVALSKLGSSDHGNHHDVHFKL